MGVGWAYPVEREVERVQEEDVVIREARVATEAPTGANAGLGVQAADGVDSATWERSNTVPPNYCIQDAGILSSEAERSR